MSVAAGNGRKARRVVTALGALWVGAWIWAGRFALLDDALIHLRYAHLLRQTGFITFDGRTASYGTSSPLYVGLLALLCSLSPEALLAKAVSVIFYFGLLAVVVRLNCTQGTSRAGWAAAGFILVSPMALQWLTDGMETSLVSLFAILLPIVALDRDTESSPRPWLSVLAFLFGAAAVLLRVELAVALFFIAVGTFCLESRRSFIRRGLPLILGGLGGMALLQLLFSHVLADTAVAKQAMPISFLRAAFEVGRSTAASLTLGAGLVTLWVVSLGLGLRAADRRGRLALGACNLLLPFVVASIAVRGQIIHGVRHVLWVYLVLISWNLVIAARAAAPDSRLERFLPKRGRKIAAISAGAALLAFWTFEGRHVASILDARNRWLLAMRSERLDRLLGGTTGAGFDIGFISFFTQADILDFSGLVNGRAVAALPTEQRVRQMARRNPDFLFVTATQAKGLSPYLDLASYRICYRYQMLTLTNEQIYFLAVRPGQFQVPVHCEQSLAGVS